MHIMLPQGPLDRLQNTGVPSDPKAKGKLTEAKSLERLLPRLLLKQNRWPTLMHQLAHHLLTPSLQPGYICHRFSHTSSSTCHLCQLHCSSIRCFLHVLASRATAFVLKTCEIVVGLW